VTRARKVVANTTWPEELDADADSFADILVVFSESLEADDVDAATRLAIEVHEIQHDFSHAIDNWLGDGDHHD
jgi:hypothetical protein